jgi:PhnB protein
VEYKGLIDIMNQKINPIPDGYHTLQSTINVADIDLVLAFVKKAFSAVETDRYNMPDGSTAHVEVKIGDSILVMGPPDPTGEFPAKIFIYVADVDEVYKKALNAGGHSLMAPEQQFYGQRVARVRDDWGNLWVIATQTEIVSPEEMQRRFAEMVQ